MKKQRKNHHMRALMLAALCLPTMAMQAQTEKTMQAQTEKTMQAQTEKTMQAQTEKTMQAQTEREWPAIPLINITTKNGEMPTATVLDAPEGCIGTGIESEYVEGRMVMTLQGDTLYDSGEYEKGASGVRIKIRGNTTGAYLQQKPYKLKLSKKADLLTFDNAQRSKDWALLSLYVWNKAMPNAESNILLLAGLAVSRALDTPWTPRTEMVNVCCNNTYYGLYHLTETVERADNRVKTEDDGFVIENDAYWWKEGDAYFKSDRLPYYMGYSFKYPDPDDLTEEQLLQIGDCIRTAEDALYDGTEAERFFDYTSFARWLLVHDILGSSDAGGSNMFLYKTSMGSSDAKIGMATPWDFDTSFIAEDDAWSAIHTHDLFYYPQLLRDDRFVETYCALWQEKKDEVYPYVERYFTQLRTDLGEAISESMDLHRTVYENEAANSLEEQIDEVLARLKTRLAALDALISETMISGIDTPSQTADRRLVRRTDVMGVDYTHCSWTSLPQRVYIETYADGTRRKVKR